MNGVKNAALRSSVVAGVAHVAMCDADARNALTPKLVTALIQAFDKIAGDRSVHAVLLTGLDDVFCAGADKRLLDDLLQGEINVEELGLPRLLLACPVPVVAALKGCAVGGGFALGLAADVVVINARQRYGLNFMDLGLTPGMGVTWLAPFKLGPAMGDELMYSTEYRRGAGFARAPGLNHIVAEDTVEPLAHDIASRIAEKPRAALVALKANQVADRLVAFDAARENEMRMHRARLKSPETAQLIKTNYIE